ncbi:MAG TPA: hypothetical protein VL475_09845, partial [Planctomycetaceae bacterium]|nr:hypothetical protein [Planctomycetaceae bacterium]
LSPGTPFRRVREIVGRSERMLMFRNNRGEREFVHPIFVLVLDIPDVPFFQLRILNENEFIFRVQLRSGLSAAARQEALEMARKRLTEVLAAKHLDRSVSFRIEEVVSFELEESRGKFKVIEFEETTGAKARAA